MTIRILLLASLFVGVAACKSNIKREEKRDESGRLFEVKETNEKTGETLSSTLYFPSGKKMMETKYEHNKIISQQLFHEENGALSEIRPFDKQGLMNGKYKMFYPNGAILREANYTNNELTGEFRTYFPNGKPRETVEMEHNEENGAFVEFYENGQRSVEGIYKNGREDGFLRKYDSTGVVVQEMNCVDGLCNTIKK
jgi:hypothetical protein